MSEAGMKLLEALETVKALCDSQPSCDDCQLCTRPENDGSGYLDCELKFVPCDWEMDRVKASIGNEE